MRRAVPPRHRAAAVEARGIRHRRGGDLVGRQPGASIPHCQPVDSRLEQRVGTARSGDADARAVGPAPTSFRRPRVVESRTAASIRDGVRETVHGHGSTTARTHEGDEARPGRALDVDRPRSCPERRRRARSRRTRPRRGRHGVSPGPARRSRRRERALSARAAAPSTFRRRIVGLLPELGQGGGIKSESNLSRRGIQE